VRFNDNKYSVSANAIGRLVEAQAHTEAHSLDGRIVAEHARATPRRDDYDSWHDVPVLARRAAQWRAVQRMSASDGDRKSAP
jgi:hypothetical protein